MKSDSHYKRHVFLCNNQKEAGKTCCANTGGKIFFDYLKNQLKVLDLHGPGKIRVSQSGCLGRCDLGPCIVIYPEGRWYTYESFNDINEIIQEDLCRGQLVERLVIS